MLMDAVKKGIFFSLFFTFGLVGIILMQINTSWLIRLVREAFYCTDYYIDEASYNWIIRNASLKSNVNYIVYKDNPAQPNLFAHFNISGSASHAVNSNEVSTNLKINRVFAWHSFTKGTVWIRYSIEIYDKNGELITGSWDVPVIISIKKNNDKWEVIQISEPP